MQPNFLIDAEEWFIYAETDLSIARVLIEASPMIGAGVAYHAQQVEEKSLKGFLMAYGVQFRKHTIWKNF
jgi:HEPN domain-containing protein